MWGFVIAPAQFRPLTSPQANFDTKCLTFECRAAHCKRSLPPAKEFPYYRSGGSLEYPSSSGLPCAVLYCRLIPSLRLSPAGSLPYLGLQIGPTPSEGPPPTPFVITCTLCSLAAPLASICLAVVPGEQFRLPWISNPLHVSYK